jgi:hypothetical protein
VVIKVAKPEEEERIEMQEHQPKKEEDNSELDDVVSNIKQKRLAARYMKKIDTYRNMLKKDYFAVIDKIKKDIDREQ